MNPQTRLPMDRRFTQQASSPTTAAALSSSAPAVTAMNDSSSSSASSRVSFSLGMGLQMHPFMGTMKKADRKRAFANAQYYSECCIRGIQKKEADEAARDADSHYQKWWIDSKFTAVDRTSSTTSTTADQDPKTTSSQMPSNQTSLEMESNERVSSHPNSNSSKRRRILHHQPSDDQSGPSYKSSNHSTGSEMDADSTSCASSSNNNKTNSSVAMVSASEDEESTKQLRQHQHNSHNSRHFHHSDSNESVQGISLLQSRSLQAEECISRAKGEILRVLRATGGDTTSYQFLECCEVLTSYYAARGWDERWGAEETKPLLAMDGKWLALSKPTFSGCKGQSPRGEYIYSLGRVAFDMFRPTNLVCSIEAVYNSISPWVSEELGRPLFFPTSIKRNNDKTRHSTRPQMRNYDIEVALTIEAGQTRKGETVENDGTTDSTSSQDYVTRRPLRCLLKNHGYCLPDPNTPNRLSIWFTGGTLGLHDNNSSEEDMKEWKELFDQTLAPRRDFSELARVLAARILVGANPPEGMSEDGKMQYTLRRPIGGHGQVFCDVLYADDSLRILKGHRGSVFVSTKIPTFA